MILVVAGTRPEAIKLATVVRDLRATGVGVVYLWTGQHTSDEMAGAPVVRAVPDWPAPDVFLAWDEAAPIRIAEWWGEHHASPPDAVLVQGDTRSAQSGARAARLLDAPLVHLEAGLRSWLPDQVEERIRREIDRRADLLLCPSTLAEAFARVDARPGTEIVVIGQTGLDAVLEAAAIPAEPPEDLVAALAGVAPWALLTLHRAELVDDPARLRSVSTALVSAAASRGLTPVWALHPRVRERATVDAGSAAVLREARTRGARLVDPIPYAVTAGLLAGSCRPACVLTDSGGLVEETYLFGIPTVIVREATERWEALFEGTATLLRPADAEARAAATLDAMQAATWPPRRRRVAYGCPAPRTSRPIGLHPTALAVAAITRFLAQRRAPEAA